MKRSLAAVLLGLVVLPLPAQQETPAPLDPEAAGPAQRIWSARMLEQQELWFRRKFTLPKDTAIAAASLVFSCDNEATVWLNGERIASGDDWEQLVVVDAKELLREGDNVIAVHGVNKGSCAALALWLHWQTGKGERGEVVTDKEWRVTDDEVRDWQKLAFDDSKWPAAIELMATPFGHNVYNGEPRGVLWQNAFTKSADAIAAALDRLRRAGDPATAQKALDAIERAVMASRTAIWKAKELERKGR